MASVLTPDIVREIENYEAQMFDYFSHYSAKLKEWYDNGGDKSEDYKVQYNRLNAEYEKYIKYIRQLRSLAGVNTDHTIQESSYVTSNDVSVSTVSSASQSTTISISSASAAANYTRYYQEMIGYFDKLLATIEQSESDTGLVSEDFKAESTTLNQSEELAVNESVADQEDNEPKTLDPCADPDLMMGQYFDRYVETKKWDWASWNNYLSWIARTYPQWYNIFVGLSQQMGIDWSDMYSKWANSVGGTTGQSEHSNFAATYARNSVQNYPMNGYSQAFEYENDSLDENFCSCCNMHFGTDRAFMIHLRGVAHTRRTLESQERQVRFINYEADWQEKHRSWLRAQYASKTSEFLSPGFFYCELCDVKFESHKTLGSHLNGRRHRENVKIFETTGDRTLLKGKRSAPVKLIAQIQTFLDVCTYPLIGLYYLTEFQLGDPDECIYRCNLCNCWLPRKSVIKHVCSTEHRVDYLKKHHPNLYAIVEQDRSDLSWHTKRLEVYARKIEDFEGRKRLKIKKIDVEVLNIKLPANPNEKPPKNKHPDKKRKKQSVDNTKNAENLDGEASSPDLEEGEVLEDSDDGEDDDDDDDRDDGDESSESNRKFEEQYRDIIRAIEMFTADNPNEKNGSNELNQPQQVNNQGHTETEDTDCKEFIEKLEQDGMLNLDNPDPNSKQSSNSLTQQFALEADWALDKLKLAKEKQDEETRNSVADITAAARIEATNHGDPTRFGRFYPMSFGTTVPVFAQVQQPVQTPMYMGFSTMPPTSCQASGRLGNQCQTIDLPNGPPPPTQQQQPEPVPMTIPTNPTTPLVTSSVPTNTPQPNPPRNGNQRLALSNSAFNVILSAIDALRSSGQLPPDMDGLPKSKLNESGQFMSIPAPFSIPPPTTSAVMTPIPQTSLTNDISRVTSTYSAMKSFNQDCENDPSMAKRFCPGVPPPHLPTPSMRNEQTNHTNYSQPSQVPSSTSAVSDLLQSFLTSMPISSTTGEFPSFSTAFPHSSSTPGRADPHANFRTARPESLDDQTVADHPAQTHSSDANQNARTTSTRPQPQSGFTPTRGPSFVLPNVPSNAEQIFDAYSLFSRRCEERKKSRDYKIPNFRNSLRTTSYRSSVNSDSSSGQTSGRKLSAIADFLGMNEPPTNRNRSQPDHGSTRSPSTNSNMTSSGDPYSSTSSGMTSSNQSASQNFATTLNPALISAFGNIPPNSFNQPNSPTILNSLNLNLGAPLSQMVPTSLPTMQPVSPLLQQQQQQQRASLWPIYLGLSNLRAQNLNSIRPHIGCIQTNSNPVMWTNFANQPNTSASSFLP